MFTSQFASPSIPPQGVRIGAVTYLNSKPLIEGLHEQLPDCPLTLDYPSRLADDLANGKLDVALIPSIGCLLIPDCEILSDACVATRGPVLSVKLYSRVPTDQIKRLALDTGSRTSATLVQILLAERHGIRPTIERLPMDQNTADSTADGVLLIGDRAMHDPPEPFHTVWDLGDEWTRSTELPFVFAVWSARQGLELTGIEEALSQTRDRGVAAIAAIARREAPALGLSDEVAERYLRYNLHFRLGPRERLGLKLFRDLAIKHGLAPKGNDLVFRDHATAG